MTGNLACNLYNNNNKTWLRGAQTIRLIPENYEQLTLASLLATT